MNLDPTVIEKGEKGDGESWPNNFVEKVNRGEDLRWVGSRCPLMHALVFGLLAKFGAHNIVVGSKKCCTNKSKL